MTTFIKRVIKNVINNFIFFQPISFHFYQLKWLESNFFFFSEYDFEEKPCNWGTVSSCKNRPYGFPHISAAESLSVESLCL